MSHNDATPQTLQAAIIHFADRDNCLAFLVNLRWPEGAICPVDSCGCTQVSFYGNRRVWRCMGCKKQFSIKVGTIFEDSPLGLDKWVCAMWMIANAKNGISSYEIHRALGVTQKTAWFMLHRIGAAMQNGSFEKMQGTVEADETYIGGKAANMHKDKKAARIQGRGMVGKEIVMGILERGERNSYHAKKNKIGKHSRVRVKHIPDTTGETLQGEIKASVILGSAVFTDAALGYRGLSPEFIHAFIDHAVTYAEGRVHTNGTENFWTLFKRAINGTYVSVNAEHLFRYLDEESFRFNEREATDAQRFRLALS